VPLLIVNADDLGYDPEIDRGILEAHARGVVGSATAMVETPFSAAALAAAPDSLGLGLHVVLTPRLSRAAAAASVRQQISRFEELRGAPPTHLDSHKHAHAAPAVLAAFAEVALERRLPVRSVDAAMRALLRARGVATPDAFLGDAALRPGWTEASLLRALERLPEGSVEIMVHPGYRPSNVRTSFGAEREIELRALTSPAVRGATIRQGLRVGSYLDLPR
jgi:chitin disaccharide deacetylase